MKFCKIFLFLLLMIMDVSTNAQEVTCEGEQLISVDILIGHPGIAPPYKPGHILVFRCTDVNLKMHGQQTIECLSNGKWNYPYPKCEKVACLLNTKENNIKMEIFPDYECPVKPGYNVTFSCNGQGLILKGQREITCQSNGEWSSPFPKCEDNRCDVPRDQHVYRPYDYFRGDMKLGTRTSYRCESGYEKMAEEATCTQDGWTPKPLCAVMAVSRKCGPPPRVNNADTIEIPKNEYNTGERVEYICFNKYILDLHPPFSKNFTCQQGEWRGNIKCLKPCTVTVEDMDKRSIQLAFTDQQKIFAPHNDHITFKCQRGKVKIGTDLRQKCNDGAITLPECE